MCLVVWAAAGPRLLQLRWNDHILRNHGDRAEVAGCAGPCAARKINIMAIARKQARKCPWAGSDPYPGSETYGALRAAIAQKDWDGVTAY